MAEETATCPFIAFKIQQRGSIGQKREIVKTGFVKENLKNSKGEVGEVT